MSLVANSDSRFLLKYLLIGIIGIAFGFYATYDGFVAYPAEIPRAAAWQIILDNEDLDDAAKDAEYKKMAEEKGWSSKRPTADESVSKIKDKIIWQYAFMAIGFGFGIPLTVWFFLNKGKSLELVDNNRIVTSWGPVVPFDQVQSFDKKNWDKKGIGIVHYNDGTPKKFVIDDLKFERQPTDEIVRIMEQAIGVEKIVNGSPEPPPKLDPLETIS